jgi:hypothetical protein
LVAAVVAVVVLAVAEAALVVEAVVAVNTYVSLNTLHIIYNNIAT